MNFEMEVELSEKGLITINLQNHGEAFEGVLLIEENVSSVYGNTQEQILELLFPQGVNENAGTMQSRNILYQKKVKLSADETKKEQFFLALPDNTSQGSLAVKCQDGNGKNIKGTTLEIPYSGTMANKAAYALTEEIPWRLLSDIPVKPQPSLWSFSLLLALYALLAGPMLYLFLKKIKQRYFLFPGITLLSFLFVLFVLGMGGKTRLVAPYITYYGKYVQREEALDYSVKFGIQAPYNESYSLYVDHSYTLVPGMQKEDFLNPVTLGIRKSSNKIKIEDMDEHYRLTMSEMPAFTPNYFRAQKQYPLEEKNGCMQMLYAKRER